VAGYRRIDKRRRYINSMQELNIFNAGENAKE
jgi:hypothetical protein